MGVYASPCSWLREMISATDRIVLIRRHPHEQVTIDLRPRWVIAALCMMAAPCAWFLFIIMLGQAKVKSFSMSSLLQKHLVWKIQAWTKVTPG